MSVGEDAPGRRRRVAPLARAAITALLVGTVACGSGEAPADEAGYGSSGVTGPTTASTTAPPVGTPFPEGVYQWSLTQEDWTAGGLPADTEADVMHHIVTFAGGTAYDVVALLDGNRRIAAEWHYEASGDHQITLTDDNGRTLTLGWELTGDELRFMMEPSEGESRDHVLWTSKPLRKVG